MHPLSMVQLLLVLLALAVSVAAVAYALLAFLADHEQQALVFVTGGGCLTAWSAARLFVWPPRA